MGDDRQSRGIGDAIKYARKRRRLTQREFAETLGAGLRTITNWEDGAIPPERIADVERVLEIKLVRDEAGDWHAIGADDTMPAEAVAHLGNSPVGTIILYVDRAFLSSLPPDVVVAATAHAQLEWLQHVKEALSRTDRTL